MTKIETTVRQVSDLRAFYERIQRAKELHRLDGGTANRFRGPGTSAQLPRTSAPGG